MDIYCRDCEVTICSVCFFLEHKSHDGSDLTKFIEEQRKQISERISTRLVNSLKT